MAIAPLLPGYRRKNAIGAQAPDMPERVFKHSLLRRRLTFHANMLHRASAAHAEVRALGLHALT